MPDLAELDQKLAALKVEVRDVAQLLERVLVRIARRHGSRPCCSSSSARRRFRWVDARHAGFWPRTIPPPAPEGAGVAAAVAATAAVAETETEPEQEPEPGTGSRSRKPEQEPEPEPEQEPESESEPESDSLAASPSHSDTDPDVVTLPVVPPPVDTPAAFAALFDLSEPPPPRISYASPADARGDTAVSPPPQPTKAEDDPASRKARMEALLDQDFDPNDFPSQPPRPRSRPPQPIVPQQAAVPAEGAQEVEEDFELLVDDEEISSSTRLEIVDDE